MNENELMNELYLPRQRTCIYIYCSASTVNTNKQPFNSPVFAERRVHYFAEFDNFMQNVSCNYIHKWMLES